MYYDSIIRRLIMMAASVLDHGCAIKGLGRFKGLATVKLFFSIIVATSIILSGLTPALGIDLLNGSKTQTVNRWPFSFGNRYIYDNAGSRWNYDYAYKSEHHRHLLGRRHTAYPHPRIKYFNKTPADQSFDGLIKHLSRNSFHHVRPYHPQVPYQHNLICR